MASNSLIVRGSSNAGEIGVDNIFSYSTLGSAVIQLCAKVAWNEIPSKKLRIVLVGTFAGLYFCGESLLVYLKSKMVVSAEFASHDEGYEWLMHWLNKQPYAKSTSRFTVSTRIPKTRHWFDEPEDTKDHESNNSKMFLLPAFGEHAFIYKHRLIWFSRSKKVNEEETVMLNTFGLSRHFMENLIKEAKLGFESQNDNRTAIYTSGRYDDWRRVRSSPSRDLDSVILAEDKKEDIVNDAKRFLENECRERYKSRGIPYRRGYLFYGPPGTGKTSFIFALAAELKLNIYILHFNEKNMSDENLAVLLSSTPYRCIVLIEDVDAVFVKRNKSDDTDDRVSFSGLLNAIDGVVAQEGRILCMTTNHYDRLDEALIRAGRIDKQVLFDKATKEQARRFFIHFYKKPQQLLGASYQLNLPDDLETTLADQFSQGIDDGLYNMAMLQEYLLQFDGDPVLAATSTELLKISLVKQEEARQRAEARKKEEEESDSDNDSDRDSDDDKDKDKSDTPPKEAVDKATNTNGHISGHEDAIHCNGKAEEFVVTKLDVNNDTPSNSGLN
ncbi:P-loop containing nucleoside triphosphate hydrolase protein [Gongronella butleri]|nr:P-loop containing nucleoside triphosphate hydrolase protein [Gongronella butleri]